MLNCPGWSAAVIHKLSPTTDQQGSFDLLFLTWANSPLLRQPGGPLLSRGHDIDAKFSVDTI